MRNLTMMTDLYQLTMMYGYYKHGMKEYKAGFDLFYRKSGENITYAVAAGLEQAIEYIQNIEFNENDIGYLRSLNLFDEDFLNYLSNMKFTGNIEAVPEGTLVFPMEPIVKVYAPIMEAQLVETALLNIINHQTLIATKASRVRQAAVNDSVLEFGLRRAQGPDAGIYGARAAMIGGCNATSNVMTGELFGIPIKGTHAHSWVMSFDSELEAFRTYADTFPDNCQLLVDTYDTLKSGVPNAIKVFDELKAKGHKPIGIRLDSGDLAYLSKKARKMLDEAGHSDALIYASGDLDEEVIWDLKAQGARIDVWGVGTRLITSLDNPALGGVYKMCAEERNGIVCPRLKVSDNPAKVTLPGLKKLYRVYDNDTGKAFADLIALANEAYDPAQPLTLFDPVETWKSTTLTDYTIKDLHVPIFMDGQLVYQSPSLSEIKHFAAKELETFWDEYKRLRRPHRYKVDLSQPLYDLRHELLSAAQKKGK